MSISKKIYSGYLLLVITILAGSVYTCYILSKHRLINNRVAEVYVPSVSSLNKMYFTISTSKMLIKTWVFIDSKPNTPGKIRLQNIHVNEYPFLEKQINSLAQNWPEQQQEMIMDICKTIKDSLFVQHYGIMNQLNSFEKYDQPMLVFDAMSKVEEDDDEVMVLTNRILNKLGDLILFHENKVTDEKQRLNKAYSNFFIAILCIGFLLLLSVVLIAYYTSRTILGPVSKLSDATSKIKEGDLTTRVQINTNDEFQELGNTFNTMVVNLQDNRDKLKQANEDLSKKSLHLKGLNTKLHESEKKLRELSGTKDKFFAVLAKDLRNPLTSLISITQTLSNVYDDIDNEERKYSVDKLNSLTQLIYKLLQNLLDWSDSHVNAKPSLQHNTDIKPIVENTIYLLKNEREQKQLSITTNIQEPLHVIADKNMLHTVFRNLISNAIEYNNYKGKVDIRGTLNGKNVQIAVKDTGPGIPKKVLQRLLSKDEQMQETEPSKSLGLFLCKEFIEKNGGELTIQSTAGKGSEIIFTLPVGRK